MTKKSLRCRGEFIITSKFKDGTVTKHRVKNRLTNLALNAMAEALNGTDPNLEIKYLAVGTSDAALDDTDTTLGTEIFRTQDLTSSRTDIGIFTSTFTILDSEAVATWKEMAIFCGTAATGTADTGIMLTRILYSKIKSSLEEVDITRIDTIGRG